MRRIKDISIKTGLHSILIIIVIFISGLYILHYIIDTKAEFEEKKQMLQQSSDEKQKDVLRHRVESVLDFIEFSRQKGQALSDSLIQQNILEYVQHIRFDHGGYVFVNTFQGQALVFDGSIVKGYKNISEMTDPDGKRLFDLEMLAYNNPEGGFMTYQFKPIDSDTLLPKISFMKGYDKWQWIIGAGFYLNDIKHELALIEAEYYSELVKDLILWISVIILTSILVILFANHFVKFLSSELSIFKVFFNRFTLLNKKIDTDGIVFSDLRLLAQEANKMIDEKTQLEKELVRSESNYRILVEQASDAIVKGDHDGKFIQVNTSACKLTGFSREELLHLRMSDLFSDVEMAEKPLRYDILKKGRSITHERNLTSKSGKIVPVEMTSSKISDGSFLSIIRDISERKKVERQLLDRKTRYKSLFENAAIPIFEEDFSEVKALIDNLKDVGVVDFREYFDSYPDKVNECIGLVRILDVNEASLKLFNSDSKKDLLNSFPRFFDQDSLEAFKNELIALAEGSMEFNCEIRILDFKGNVKFIDLRLAVTPGYESSLSRVLVSFIDITENKEINRALQESEERYRNLVDMIPEGVVVHCEGKIVFCNDSAISIMKASGKESFTDKSVFEFVHPDSREMVIERIKSSQLNNEPAKLIEEKFICFDGTIIFVEVAGVPFQYFGKPAMLTVFKDIGDRKEAEMQLSQYREKLEEMVKERTAEIEVKNKELIEKNIELERFNQLFVGREFRIKELRDKVKKLEEKLSEQNK
ncbi:MAG: PAS domain S-box protein [Bacteroidales bacterium]|nr:PAS domain S-box protein [Bacteroidales bacterium]MCF8455192.1 PAS domain S-box protein [Bacteroidales bacterium]